MTASDNMAPEFSVIADLQAIGRHVKKFHLEPDEAARKKIAKRLGVPSVERLEGDVSVRAGKTDILIEGLLRATLVRECVSSLEEMTEEIDEGFEISFLRQEPEDSGDEEAEEPPEIHEDDTLDLGELLVQQLSLAMDPFPRKQGAQSLADEYGRAEADSPFRDLKGMFDKNE